MNELKQERLHVVSPEVWEANQALRRDWIEKNLAMSELQAHDERCVKRKKENEEVKAAYPFSVILEGSYPEHDLAARWCWRAYGPPQCQKCQNVASEYPACPQVLAIGEKKTYSWQDKDGGKHDSEYMYYDDEKVEDHGHEGTWRTFWLGKTGYDYGFSTYLFSSQADLDSFMAAVPQLEFDEDE